MRRGAEFGDVQPRSVTTGLIFNDFLLLDAAGPGLEYGQIQRVTGLNEFRLGQQILFWIGVSNPIQTEEGVDNWISKLRLKPWWMRPNSEFRSPGFPRQNSDINEEVFATTEEYIASDRAVFGGVTQDNNRYVWIPSPKRLDVTPFDTPPPTIPPARHSDSLMLDDVWTWDLDNPNNATYQNAFNLQGQQVSRWSVFMYPAMGYSLGFTWSAEFGNENAEFNVFPRVSVTYAIGTLGGTNYQESIG